MPWISFAAPYKTSVRHIIMSAPGKVAIAEADLIEDGWCLRDTRLRPHLRFTSDCSRQYSVAPNYSSPQMFLIRSYSCANLFRPVALAAAMVGSTLVESPSP